MPEYLKHRCCMCPQRNASSQICPSIPGVLHPKESPCRFVRQYKDARGFVYFVRPGIGQDTFKTFYRKPGESSEHGWRCVPWRSNVDEAQADLNQEAKKRGWEEVQNGS